MLREVKLVRNFAVSNPSIHPSSATYQPKLTSPDILSLTSSSSFPVTKSFPMQIRGAISPVSSGSAPGGTCHLTYKASRRIPSEMSKLLWFLLRVLVETRAGTQKIDSFVFTLTSLFTTVHLYNVTIGADSSATVCPSIFHSNLPSLINKTSRYLNSSIWGNRVGTTHFSH